MNKKKPTMRDVANLAGVTQPTVSYVINGTANISKEVKVKVCKAIKELNYHPNYYARVLKTNKTNIVGIVIPDITNEYYSKIVQIIDNKLSADDYTVIISSTNYDSQNEFKSIHELINYNAEFILVTYQLNNTLCWNILKESKKKVVVLEGGKHCGGLPCINTDNFYGGYTATKFLLDIGKKRISYVSQKSNIEALLERCKGYIQAMKEQNLYDKNLIFLTKCPKDKWNEGKELGKKLLKEDIDGVVVSSDIIAVGIIKTLITNNIDIPKDIAIVGYDDIPLAELFLPSLSTISQPIESMCLMAIDWIQKDSNELLGKNIVLKPKLIVRETS